MSSIDCRIVSPNEEVIYSFPARICPEMNAFRFLSLARPRRALWLYLQQVGERRVPVRHVRLTRRTGGDDVPQGAEAPVDVLRLPKNLTFSARLAVSRERFHRRGLSLLLVFF